MQCFFLYFCLETRYTGIQREQQTKENDAMLKKRAAGIDAVRTTAIVFVVTLHAISTSGILDQPGASGWGLALYLRHLTLACVPLFLMLTGYLQNRKTFCAGYYRGIIPLGLSYLVTSVLCVIAHNVQAGGGNGILGAVYSILNFSANAYAWYFEMYIALFLLIPFLNMIYWGIRTRLGKRALLITLVLLTLLPDTLAGFSPYYDGSGSTVALDIFPDFFKSMYPILFYFFGCYIAEFKPKLRGAKKLLALCAPLLPAALVALYTHFRSWYAWYLCNGYQTVTVAITAIAVFLALYDMEPKSIVLRKATESVAVCTFEMYLLSYLWDSVVYHVWDVHTRLSLLIAALLVLVGSFVSAVLLRICLRPIGNVLLQEYDKRIGAKVEKL